MDAKELYSKLDEDFEVDQCKDEWNLDFNEYITPQFKERQMGVMLDNTEEIDEVFTAVFPSDKVLKEILALDRENILLFTHHAMTWDIRNTPKVFSEIGRDLLEELQERKISLYALHVPLDKNGKYSTSVNLAKAVGIVSEEGFCEYFGVQVGMIGKTTLRSVEQLADKLAYAVGHKTKIYDYGDKFITDGRVAVAAGGGCQDWVLEEVAERDVNTLLTGITVENEHTRAAHELAKAMKINIIGGSHYSTEKFACMAMTTYFEKLGIPSQFIEDDPILEDI